MTQGKHTHTTPSYTPWAQALRQLPRPSRRLICWLFATLTPPIWRQRLLLCTYCVMRMLLTRETVSEPQRVHSGPCPWILCIVQPGDITHFIVLCAIAVEIPSDPPSPAASAKLAVMKAAFGKTCGNWHRNTYKLVWRERGNCGCLNRINTPYQHRINTVSTDNTVSTLVLSPRSSPVRVRIAFECRESARKAAQRPGSHP